LAKQNLTHILGERGSYLKSTTEMLRHPTKLIQKTTT
jgi:hypothetical protein